MSSAVLPYVSPHRVMVRGLPYHTTKLDILDFFRDWTGLSPTSVVFPYQFRRGGFTQLNLPSGTCASSSATSARVGHTPGSSRRISDQKQAPPDRQLLEHTNSGIAYVGFGTAQECHVAVDKGDKCWLRNERKIDVLEIAEHLKRAFNDPTLKVPYEITMQTEVDGAKRMEVGRKQREMMERRRSWMKYDNSGRRYARQDNIAPFDHK
ncbi:unnamed protein product [Amoebophrya sp. A25]|nr:unnamed protein product [Amoebophrya sp. A25]|eukprot:GSA25T00001949001.1